MKMKMKMVLSLVVILVAVSGCFSKESKNADTTPLQTAPTTSSSDFELSDREQEVYNNFQKDLNEQHLKGLEPISIAKLYVQARLDNKNDVVYALYTDKSGYVQWFKYIFGLILAFFNAIVALKPKLFNVGLFAQ